MTLASEDARGLTYRCGRLLACSPPDTQVPPFCALYIVGYYITPQCIFISSLSVGYQYTSMKR